MRAKYLLLLIFLIILPIAYADNVTFTITAPEEADGTFEANIAISSVTALDSITFILDYDDSILAVESVESGTFTSTAAVYLNKVTNQITFNVPEDDGKTGSGNIITISFKTIGNEGKNSHINMKSVAILDASSETIDVTKVNQAEVLYKKEDVPAATPVPTGTNPIDKDGAILIQGNDLSRRNFPEWYENIYMWIGIGIIVIILVVYLFLRKNKEPENPFQPTNLPPTYPQYPDQPSESAQPQQYQDYEQPQQQYQQQNVGY